MIDSVLKIMPRLNIETRRRVIVLKQAGYSFVEIKKRLGEEDIAISLQALHNLVKKYQAKNTLMDLPRHTMPRKLNSEMMAALNQALLKDDELTARKARDLLLQQWSTLQISLPTIRRVRKELGWVCTRPHYCQLIRDVSIQVHLYACVSCILARKTACQSLTNGQQLVRFPFQSFTVNIFLQSLH